MSEVEALLSVDAGRVPAGAVVFRARDPESEVRRLRMVLALHYDEDLTYREIAKLMQVSEPRVCQLHGDALKKLREAMPGDE